MTSSLMIGGGNNASSSDLRSLLLIPEPPTSNLSDNASGKPYLRSMESNVSVGSVGSADNNNATNINNGVIGPAIRKKELIREFLLCLSWAVFGWCSPTYIFRGWMGGVRMRPIPYEKTRAGDVLLDLTLTNEFTQQVTISSTTLILTSVLLPLIAISVLGYFFSSSSRRIYDTHSGICAVFLAIGCNEFITQILKIYVGRLRPNFYKMCEFDTESLQCTANIGRQYEARMSFPSGHSSLSFCGMTILMWFLLGRVGLGRVDRLRQSDVTMNGTNAVSGAGPTFGIPVVGRKVKTLLSIVPLLISCFIGTSRIVDNWHHPSDVIAGSILGFMCSTVSYHLWYPHVFSSYSGIPYSFISSDAVNGRGTKEKLPLYNDYDA